MEKVFENFRCRLIALDLDGTLLNSQKELSERNRAALEAASKKGIYIVPSTGRFYGGTPESVRGMDFLEYAIVVNGAQVYDIKGGGSIAKEEIPWETSEKIYDILDRLPVIYDCYTGGAGYMDEEQCGRIDEFIKEPQINGMIKMLNTPVHDFRKFAERGRYPSQKIEMFFLDEEMRQKTWKMLEEKFPELILTSSISNNIEMNAENANKGEALKSLCAYLNIDPGDVIAFGDSSNDVSMLRAAGIGVAMGNASEEFKGIADYVADTNDNDGVAKVIEKFCLR